MRPQKTNEVEDAVILMAGAGSRLNNRHNGSPNNGAVTLKPLVKLLGRPLVCYTFDSLAACRIKRVHAVVGFQAERLMDAVRDLAPPEIELSFIHNADWQKQNGLSLIAAVRNIQHPFILTMADHLFDTAIVELLIKEAAPDKVAIAIDRKIESIFDLPDAMKVQTAGNRLVELGKELQVYDAIDTGLFFCPAGLTDLLGELHHGGNYSLADVVRQLARMDRAEVIDIGDNWWQDVDTPEMLRHAEQHLLARHRGAMAGQIIAAS